MKDATQFGGLLFLLSLIGLCWTSVASADDDNKITIKQTGGDNLTLQIQQIGIKNEIKMYDAYSYLNGANMSLHFYQNNDG